MITIRDNGAVHVNRDRRAIHVKNLVAEFLRERSVDEGILQKPTIEIKSNQMNRSQIEPIAKSLPRLFRKEFIFHKSLLVWL
jgi:hypothetical protein